MNTKELLLKLAINKLTEGQLSALKALAFDLLENPDLNQDKVGSKLSKIEEIYCYRNQGSEQIKKLGSTVDLDATYTSYRAKRGEDTNYFYYVASYVVVKVDMFLTKPFICKNELTGELKSFENLQSELAGDKVSELIYITEELPSSIEPEDAFPIEK